MRQRYQRPPIGAEWTTGAGATIGPAMTFGYIAALDLAGAG